MKLVAISVPAKPCMPCFASCWSATKPILVQVLSSVAPVAIQAALDGSLATKPEQVATDIADKAFVEFVQRSLLALKKHNLAAFEQFVGACRLGSQITPEVFQTLLTYNLINPNGTINEIVLRVVNALTMVANARGSDKESIEVMKLSVATREGLITELE